MKVEKEKVIFLGIVFLGVVLRLLFIDKPSGLWYDEMIMYNQAIKSFPFGIITETFTNDVHFPLYQLLLSLWMKVFSNNDIILRLFSVLMGSLTVVFAFFAGKEIKDEKLGNIFAFLTAINALLIFYSQEIKFYIMLAMLACISLWALARIKNKNDALGYLGYILSNTAIIYTFTIGIFYVFSQFIVFFAYTLINSKKLIKNFLIASSVLLLSTLPFTFYVWANINKFESHSWYFNNNIYTIFVLIQNYFSPALNSLYNNPIVYIPKITFMTVIFIYIPILLSFYGIYKALKENSKNWFILAVPLIFLICEIVLSNQSGFRIITRYTILALVPLLFLVSLGLYSLKDKFFKAVISYLFIINIFFLIAVPTSAVRGYRDMGVKPVADAIMQDEITDKDIIIFSIRTDTIDKYLVFGGKKFSLLRDFSHKEYSFNKTKGSDRYESFREFIFDNGLVNKGYEKYFYNEVISNMQKGDRIFLICEKDYNLYPFKDVANYKKYPLLRLNLSKLYADTIRICEKNLKFSTGNKLQGSMVLVFKK